MKLKIQVALSLLLIVLSIFSIVGVVNNFKEAEAAAPEITETGSIAVLTVSQTGVGAVYTLKEYNGHIAVFTELSDRIPIKVTDIETATLRAGDRELLDRGIPVYSEPELLQLLEDFGS